MSRRLLMVLAALALAGCGREEGQSFAPDSDARREADKLGLEPDAVDAAALRQAVRDRQVRRFYELRGWKPAWDEATAAALLDALNEAEGHALSKSMFLAFPVEGAPAEKEAALTRAALDYASALARGRLDPQNLFPIYTLRRPSPDLATGLATAMTRQNVEEWFVSLSPQDAEYKALSAAYLHYLQTAAREGPGIAGGRSIKAGKRDPRVPRLAEALRSNGYLQGKEQADPALYTPAMAKAVTNLQNDYGIKPDGIVGPDTLEVLNTSAADKARQLAVNLERRRWLDRSPPATRIDVNTAATFLDYWRGGRHRDQRRVVVGQPDWETPQLGSPIFQLVANPSWTVPKSIEEEEILPKGPGYMWENNMVWKDDWIVQLPGPENSLGLVKLDMRNDQSIYLHDTPAKPLFAQNERHRSHGCVRVEDAVGFARMLASDDGILSDFDGAQASGEETFVKLRSQIPVRLLYHSVFVDRGGGIRFRTDAYGWDERVAVALGMSARAGRRFRSHLRDVGP